MISGIWLSVKSNVIGMMPHTLKATQVSVGEATAPDHLVDHRQEQEEQAPAEGQLPPALGIEMEGRIEDVAEQRLAEGQAAEQHAPNSVLTMVGFILMKMSFCSQSVSAPNTNTTTPDTSGMIGSVRMISHDAVERDRGRDHEQRGRHEDRPAEIGERREPLDQPFAARIGEEEDQQRPELQRQLEHRVDLPCACGSDGSRSRIGSFMVYATPAIALAKSPAEKGSRSSTCSPTPMK